MATIAAHCLQARPEELSWGDGSIHVQGTDRQMSYAEIARFAYFRTAELPRSLEPGLAVLAHWEPELRATFNAAAHLALVEVDLCTASLRWIMVEDCGTGDAGHGGSRRSWGRDLRTADHPGQDMVYWQKIDEER